MAMRVFYFQICHTLRVNTSIYTSSPTPRSIIQPASRDDGFVISASVWQSFMDFAFPDSIVDSNRCDRGKSDPVSCTCEDEKDGCGGSKLYLTWQVLLVFRALH